MPCSRVAPRIGTTRSRLCRLRSTTQTTSPSSPTIGSSTASQQAPSSSSASPEQRVLAAGLGPTSVEPARRSAAPAPPRSARSPRSRPSPSSSRPGRGPSRGWGSTAARRTRAAWSGTRAGNSPIRWLIACSTGDACGLTDTRSSRRRCRNHSSVMIVVIDALDAWCPPTFSPDGSLRTRLACCTIAVASQSTRRSTAATTSVPGSAVTLSAGAVRVIVCSLSRSRSMPAPAAARHNCVCSLSRSRSMPAPAGAQHNCPKDLTRPRRRGSTRSRGRPRGSARRSRAPRPSAPPARRRRCRRSRSSASRATGRRCAPRRAAPRAPRARAHTRARTSASFSPIPAVNTTASSRPSAAAYAPTVQRIR